MPTQTLAGKMSIKTVFLIRHAESAENVLMQGVVRTLNAVRQFSLPAIADLRGGAQLASNMVSGANDHCTLSINGLQQVSEVHEILLENRDKFFGPGVMEAIAKRDVLVTHSPMLRAKQTCEGLLTPAVLETSVCALELEALREIVPIDYVHYRRWTEANQRIREFECWLAEQKEEIVFVVGHSHYFKRMLGVDYKFSNCDVWRASFDVDMVGESDPKARWKDLQRLCGSQTAKSTFGAEGPASWNTASMEEK